MSTHFRLPHNFVMRNDIGFCPKGAVEHVEAKRKQNCDSAPLPIEPAPLRDSHIVLYAIEASITLYASFKKWRNRRRTLRSLANLDDHQLRDIGLTRDETGYHALND